MARCLSHLLMRRSRGLRRWRPDINMLRRRSCVLRRRWPNFSMLLCRNRVLWRQRPNVSMLLCGSRGLRWTRRRRDVRTLLRGRRRLWVPGRGLRSSSSF